LFDPLTTLVFILALSGMAVVTARRWPVLSFCVLRVLLHLMIESSVIPLELAYEHRMYLPMAGVAWLDGWGLFSAVMNERVAAAVTAAVAVLLTAATHAMKSGATKRGSGPTSSPSIRPTRGFITTSALRWPPRVATPRPSNTIAERWS